MNFILSQELTEWASAHEVQNPINLGSLLNSSLFGPLEDFFKYPGKNLRADLVQLGFILAKNHNDQTEAEEERIKRAAEIVEAIHAGSLIVDDIEDGSELRRNTQTLHLKYGLPRALNAGNWLYFHGLMLISELKLGAEVQTGLMEDCLDLILKAHYGQAIDVGTKINEIDQAEVRGICLASLELKTGTLLSLAMRLGWAIGGGERSEFQKISEIGLRLGTTLQIFDDIGNFLQPKSLGPSKRLEDMRNLRPSWIWAVASSENETSYRQFIEAALDLNNENKLIQWMSDNNFEKKLFQSAQDFLVKTLSHSQQTIEKNQAAMAIIQKITNILEKAYV